MAHLHIINPNSTEAMTASILASAKAAAPEAQITAATSHKGPAAIEGAQDGARATPPLLELIAAEEQADAIIIACFDDTGLAEAKAMARVPVIGIGEAAYTTAQLLGHRFSVVTTLPVSLPVLRGNIEATGFGGICASVRAANIPVLTLEHDREAAFDAIHAEAARALAEDGCSAIVLGCAGMTGLPARLATLDAAIIDGVEAAVHLALAATRLRGAA